MDKSYRIHTNIASDTVLNVNMQQDFEFLEVLSMRLRQKDAYKLHSSNYGVIIGRVLANDAFGIPNAKISVFIEKDTNDSTYMEDIYPYTDVLSNDKDGRRYNLLPDDSDDDCYRIVGTFPNKRLLLDNDIQLEIYDKYWKYTTVTNNAGDYMIFGVPSGNQQIHVDIDLSDIGILSQKPRDFEYKGYYRTLFDNPNQFKEGTNLDGLAQLFSQNKSVFVYPFWGDADNGVAAITRCDIQIQYKFEPTCVFMGSIVSDNEGNSIAHDCSVNINNGMNDQLVASEGTIEMIRKTPDGLVEEYQIRGNQLIDSDGVWCYQIPMNLDFIGTDEYGNITPTDNPSKGIPTRTQVRFRISKRDTGDEGFSNHTAKYLVPMNPIFSEKDEVESLESGKEHGTLDCTEPVIDTNGRTIEDMYIFGSNTPQSCFRDLYWNNVYSVKNYIPKVQTARRAYAKNYGALKGANIAKDKNPIPFNKFRADLPFIYILVCVIVDIIIFVLEQINKNLICVLNKTLIDGFNKMIDIVENSMTWFIGGSDVIPDVPHIPCVSAFGELSEKYKFKPGCDCEDGEENVETSTELLRDLVAERLAEDYDIVKLDFYQDWLNGCLYMPLWYWRKRKKKTYLFGLIRRSAKNQHCDCDETYDRVQTYVTCNVQYSDDELGITSRDQINTNEDKWHKNRAKNVRYHHGLIKDVQNKDGLTVYYYSAIEATNHNENYELLMSERTEPFYAVRLYATDIILLGNLDEDNLYGIPQLFNVLPSTTANIPPMAAIDINEEELDEDEELTEADSPDDSGTTVITGMNWRRNPGKDVPSHKRGLFLGLYCNEIKTQAKTCFNVERLSELGTNSDMSYKMEYSANREVKWGRMFPDGFISKLELEDMDNRAMFATMNHIGFVPQPYQDSIGGYTTQVEDENTNYLIPKFKYIYPVDYDGRQQLVMNEYNGNADETTQRMYDEVDKSYIAFRLGAYDEESNRKRHFYYYDDYYEMPLYNNSFYFYFGVNKGSTAIDKFNTMFHATCYKRNKNPFTFKIDSKGNSLCSDAYVQTNRNMSYGYIRFTSDDIQTPFSYTLYDSFGEIVISEDGMEITDFAIGGKIEGGEVKPYGVIKYQLCQESETVDCTLYKSDGRPLTLENQDYILSITDVNGKTISEPISLSVKNASFDYHTEPLGTKYIEGKTSRNYICESTSMYYGLIVVDKVYIDGYEFTLTSASCELYSPQTSTLDTIDGRSTDTRPKYRINATAKASTEMGKSLFGENTINIRFVLSTEMNEGKIPCCLCDEIYDCDDTVSNDWVERFVWNESSKSFEFRVYRPGQYILSMTQMCNGLTTTNTTTENIVVENGTEFDTYLNGMPIRFLLGVRDEGEPDSSRFYNKDGVTNPKGVGIDGWYRVHREDVYKFAEVNEDNKIIWEQYVPTNGISIIDSDYKKKIIQYKFERMFELSNVVYMTDTSNPTFDYRVSNSRSLTRALYPTYEVDENTNTIVDWLYSDTSRSRNIIKIPNVVGSNYQDGSYSDKDDVRFNHLFHDRNINGTSFVKNYVGNYFAAFSNEGGYTSTNTGNCEINVHAIPYMAGVNLTKRWKDRTENILYRFDTREFYEKALPAAHTHQTQTGPCTDPMKSSNPYLRALYVDRAFDYDFIVMLPTEDTNGFSTNPNIWSTVRLSGVTYNGIDMSYDINDNGRNIISATTDVDGTITPNNKLEYSYNVENGETIYNEPTANDVWDNNEDGHHIKKFHTAKVCDIDVRNYFWSPFNKERLSMARPDFTNYDHYADTPDYNANEHIIGDFSDYEFPCKRLIDIGEIKSSNGGIDLNIKSFSYGSISVTNKNGEIFGKAGVGDTISLKANFRGLVKHKEDVNNLLYVYDGEKFIFGDDKSIDLNFTYDIGIRNVKGHKIYPIFPRLIKVRDNSTSDAITAIKDYSGSNFYEFLNEHSMINAGNRPSSQVFGHTGSRFSWDITYFGICERNVIANDNIIGMYVGNDLLYTKISNFRYVNTDKLVPISNFNNIIFAAGAEEVGYEGLAEYKTKNNNGVTAFAIMGGVDFISNSNLYHTKRIRVYNFSRVYDLSPISLRVSGGDFVIDRNNKTLDDTCSFKLKYCPQRTSDYREVDLSVTVTPNEIVIPIITEISSGDWYCELLITLDDGFRYALKFFFNGGTINHA